MGWKTSTLAAVAAFAGATLTACAGGTVVTITADRETISAGGIDFALIAAHVEVGGSAASKGSKVAFDTTAGSFSVDTSLLSTEVGTDGSGQATAKLYSTPTQGKGTVTASYYDDLTGITTSASITITFGISDDRLPVDGTFRMSCNAVNIGALRSPLPNVEVSCELRAQTRGGTTIPASVFDPTFLAEAGTMLSRTDDAMGKKIVAYSPKGGASTPKDVDPDPSLNEPSYLDKNGGTRNPRDGLATLVAIVDGEEQFTDSNGNGRYDQGEPFTDAAEPFVDSNDNDQWDPDEAYVDVNGNGKWDQANGVWDAKTKIMAVYKLLWTGKLDSSRDKSRINSSGASTTIPDKGKLTLTGYVLDANLNPLAGFSENQDTVEWTLSSGGDATSNDQTSQTMANALGFEFDTTANTERKRWRIRANSFTAPSYAFTVEDGYPADEAPQTNFSVSLKTYASPGPAEGGSYVAPISESVTPTFDGFCD
jgi:hypothetical protein